MNGMQNAKRRQAAFIVGLLAVLAILGAWAGPATALVINTPITSPCPYTLVTGPGEDLLITSTGSIRCDGPGAASASDITITVTDGNMEMQAGAKITAENVAGGVSGNITISVPKGDFIMRGPGVAGGPSDMVCAQVEGACISASSNGGPSKGGIVTITVGNFPNTPAQGTFLMEPGSAVLANSLNGSGGEIIITAGLEMDVDGLVRSYGGISGVANQPPGGGPITLKAGCELTITPDGVVSSEGKDPGADLVHLEGCTVTINGIVRSFTTGNGGHAIPVNPANHCNNDPATHPGPFAYTACVEIWAQTVIINSIAPNKGEVHADGITTSGPTPTRSWIDIYAANTITINNDNVGPYSVHANAGPTTDDFAGLITVKSRDGKFVAGGGSPNFAIQANALTASGRGGNVIVEAFDNVELNAAVIQVNGAATGPARAGGTIFARSYNGTVTGNAPGALSATAGGVNGTITLQGCGTAGPNDGVNYTGTSTPAATISPDQCGGNPDLPAAVDAELLVLAPICASPECGGNTPGCVKRGRKYNDIAGQPGLPGWQICAFDDLNQFVSCETTNAQGNYEFNQLTCDQTYTFCEVLQPNWTQTFPVLPSVDPTIVSCQGLIGAPGPLAPVGYKETLVANVPSEGNDFGNVTGGGDCPKFPTLKADVTITIDPNDATQIQDAINGLGIGKTLLILPLNGKKNEIITINKNVKVVGCSITLDGQNASGVVVTIGGGAAGGSTTDVHATGGTVAGYKLEGNTHTVKNVRAFGNAIGFWVTGNANLITGAQGTTGNGIGFKIDGDNNTVDSASAVTSNLSHGAQLTSGASGNTIKKSTFVGNGGEGILVEGPSNIISENKAYSNVLNGINVSGASTQLLKNLAGDKSKGNGLDGIRVSGNGGPMSENTARSNSGNGFNITGSAHNLSKNTAGGDAQQNNAACEFVIAPGNVNGGNNKANGVVFNFVNAVGVACQE